MVHGKPDWNRTTAPSTTFQLQDDGELAARLDSIVTFDRRGDVVWLDDFEAGIIKWVPGLGGTAAAAAADTTVARNGAQSALLTAGSDGIRAATITHSHYLPVASRLGYELSVNLLVDIESWDMRQLVFDGSNLTEFRVRWSDVDSALAYLDSLGAWVDFASSVDLRKNATHYHTAKLVVDQAAGEYVRFLLDNAEYSLADIAAQVSASAVLPEWQQAVRVTGNAGDNDTLNVDDVILTQNEPA